MKWNRHATPRVSMTCRWLGTTWKLLEFVNIAAAVIEQRSLNNP